MAMSSGGQEDTEFSGLTQGEGWGGDSPPVARNVGLPSFGGGGDGGGRARGRARAIGSMPRTIFHRTLATLRRRGCLSATFAFLLLGLVVVALLSVLTDLSKQLVKLETPAGAIDFNSLRPLLVPKESEFVTVYSFIEDATMLFMEFRGSSIGFSGTPKPLLFSAIFAQGSFDEDDPEGTILLHYPAENTESNVFHFQITEDLRSVDVMREEMYVRSTDPEDQDTTRGSAPATWVASLPVVNMAPGDDEDGTELKVIVMANALLENGLYVTSIIPEEVMNYRIKLSHTRAYPRNVDFTVEYQLRPFGTLDNVQLALAFSVAALPEVPMTPRVADERVGFFTTTYKDMGDHRAETAATRKRRESTMVDTTVKVINRRRLSTDPTLALLYHIDPSVPPTWWPAMKEGVERWQPALEQLGYGKAAIRAVLPSDDDFPIDYDAGDVRYNSITWAIDLQETFALGPSTVDPRTGEILRGAIVFTSGWVKSYLQGFDHYDTTTVDPRGTGRSLSLLTDQMTAAVSGATQGGQGLTARLGDRVLQGVAGGVGGSPSRASSTSSSSSSSPLSPHASRGDLVQALLAEKLPSFAAFSSSGATTTAATPSSRSRSRLATSIRHHSSHDCQHERRQDASMPLLSLAAAAAVSSTSSSSTSKAASGSGSNGTAGYDKDAMIALGIMDVVTHEVGHTMGLRHNFRGSAALTAKQAQNPAYTAEHGLTSSVMDYLPVNFASSGVRKTALSKTGQLPDLFTPVIGEYDYWAIRYGYTIIDEEGKDGPERLLTQHPTLKSIADLALPFSTDEDGATSTGMDPLNSLFDIGSEPVDYWEDRLVFLSELRAGLLDRAVWQDEKYTRYAPMERLLLNNLLTAGLYSAKYIGGFQVDKQRRLSSGGAAVDKPADPVSLERQQRALDLVLKVVGSGFDDTLFPSADHLPLMVEEGGSCQGLEQACYATDLYDVVAGIGGLKKTLLLSLLSPERLMRVRLHGWQATSMAATDSPQTQTMSLTYLMDQVVKAVFGDDLLAGQEVTLPENWDVQLFLVDLLMLLGQQTSSLSGGGLPGDVIAVATGKVYDLRDSVGLEEDISSEAKPLIRAFQRKLAAWEVSTGG